MTIKEFFVNALILLSGIVIACLAIGYIWWFSTYIDRIDPTENFINVILVSLGYIIPTLILVGSGLFLFMKSLMDPWRE